MSKSLLFCVFMLFCILTYGSTSNADTSKPQKETKALYAMIMESNKSGIENTSPRVHVVQDNSISRFAKGGSVGAGAGAANTVKHSPNSRSSAGYSTKPSSLFMAAPIFGMVLVLLSYEFLGPE